MIRNFRHHFNTVIRLMIGLIMVLIVTTTTAQTKRALVVGISEYQQTNDHAWSPIHGSNDADLIIPILKKQGFKATKICDKAATANRVRKELNSLITSCGTGDVVYLHFSCHGQPFEDLDGDEEDGWDESLIPFDAQMKYQKGIYEGGNHITDDELFLYLQKIRNKLGPQGLVCVVIDACHSGGSSRGDDSLEEDEELFERGSKEGFSSKGKAFRPRINAKGNFQIPSSKGSANIIILEACRSYQSNYEIKQEGKYYGPLSYYICKVLKKQPLAPNISWVQEVKNLMNSDKRLTRQNMVYETTIQ